VLGKFNILQHNLHIPIEIPDVDFEINAQGTFFLSETMKAKKIGSRKKVVRFYEKDAEKYEEERFASDRGKYDGKTQKDIVFSLFNSWKNLDILEVGCGTGRFSIEISRRGGNVKALDPTVGMLKEIEKVNIGENKVKLIRGSGYKLPFKDNAFDGCICINVLNHVPNYEVVLTEVYRVLKPNAFFTFNFANLHSILLPAGLLVNFRRQSLINPVYTMWYTLRKVNKDLQIIGFKISDIKGLFLPQIGMIPLRIIKKLNKFSRDPILKYLSSGIFVKVIAKKEEET
jgi:ubiquinone/menaquinone biosynthesis C-methylase UbiE